MPDMVVGMGVVAAEQDGRLRPAMVSAGVTTGIRPYARCQPVMAYDGPMMRGKLGSNTVLTSSDISRFRERLDFSTYMITRFDSW